MDKILKLIEKIFKPGKTPNPDTLRGKIYGNGGVEATQKVVDDDIRDFERELNELEKEKC